MPLTLQTFATGDTDYIAKLNSNGAATKALVDALETGKLDATQKGAPSGVATLGADGKVLPGQLPNLAGYEQIVNKGTPNGYAGLGSDGKVPMAQLPPALAAAPGTVDFTPYQQKIEKGAASGYASLDAATKVPVAQVPDLSATYQVVTGKGAANGYAGLDATGKVPNAQLPDYAAQLYLVHAFVPGRPANGALVTAILPSVAAHFAAALTGSRAKAGVAATASTVFSVKKNGTQVGTITFGVGGTAGTFAAAAQIDLTTADELTVEAPAAADATLADIRITLHGTR